MKSGIKIQSGVQAGATNWNVDCDQQQTMYDNFNDLINTYPSAAAAGPDGFWTVRRDEAAGILSSACGINV